MNDEYARMVEDARKADEAERAKMEAIHAKRERAEIALRFAVGLAGTIKVEVPAGTVLGTLADDTLEEFADTYARWGFKMADAFLAARDGAK